MIKNIKNSLVFLFVFLFLIFGFQMPYLFADTETQTGKNSKLSENINKVKYLNQTAESKFKIMPDSSIRYSRLALKIAESINYTEGKAFSLMHIGFANIYKKQPKIGFDYIQKAVATAEKANDKIMVADLKLEVGSYFYQISDIDNALMYLKSAQNNYSELKAYQKEILSIIRISNVYIDIGAFSRAMDFLYKGLTISENMNYQTGKMLVNNNIGFVYLRQDDSKTAKSYFQKAIEIADKIKDKSQQAAYLTNLAIIYADELKFEEALNNYFKAVAIYSEIRETAKKATLYANIGKAYLELKKTKEAFQYCRKALEIALSIGNDEDKIIAEYYTGDAFYEICKLDSAEKYFSEGVKLSEKLNNWYWMQFGYYYLSLINSDKNDFRAAYEFSTLYVETKDSMTNQQKARDMGRSEMKYENEIKEEQLNSERRTLLTFLISFIVGFILIGILAFVLYHLYNVKKKSNLELSQKNIEVSIEQKKSHDLLLNILPESIADRLIGGETTIADSFEEASVIFIDISEFTLMSAGSPADLMVVELNKIFTLYDKISAKYGVEKIKTIGDCYMAASGIPKSREDHAEAIASMALETIRAVNDYKSESGLVFRFRIGIDCGPVVAGVIGEQKFIYDLWGDTVNTASRMEENGVVGKIQVTDRFKNKCNLQKIKESNIYCAKSENLRFIERGEIDIKGKGKMKTWFLEC